MINYSIAIPDTKVLVADSERATRNRITDTLSELGYLVDDAASGDVTIDLLHRGDYNVVLLDLKMPGVSGVELLAQAEEVSPQTAFVILSAYASADLVIDLFRMGASDFLKKPSTEEKIVEVIRQVALKQQEQIRQQNAIKLLQQAFVTMSALDFSQAYTVTSAPEQDPAGSSRALNQVGAISVNSAKQIVCYRGRPLDLTPIEYRLIHYMAAHPNVVVSYQRLVRVTHQTTMDEADARALLRTHVYRLSRKLDDKENSPLQTVRGRGVILNTV